MATKIFKGRIQNKHDTEANWSVATNFKPLAGELIIYDEDNAHSTPRFKVGDGNTSVTELPFVFADFAKLNENNTFTSKNYFDYKIYLGTPEDNVAELSFKDYTTDYHTPEKAYIRTVIQAGAEYNGRPTIDFVNTEGGTTHDMIALTKWDKPNEHYYRTALENFVSSDPGNTGSHAAAIAHYELDGDTGAFTNQYRAIFPFKSGTVALTSDIPDTSFFAKLSTTNTFTGTNTFSGDTTFASYVAIRAENYMYGLLASVSNVSNKDVGIYGGGSGSSQEAHVSVGGGNAPYDYTHYCDGKIVTRNTFENDTDQIIIIPHKAGVIALTSDIPVANSGTGTTELTSLKIGDTIYTIPSGGGSGDVTAAGDNTFTGTNTFTGDFSRKTRDSSGVIYYKESISDQGFTVGVGATEAATGTQAIYGYGSIKVTAGAAGTGTLSLPVKTGTLALTSDVSAVKTKFFPVGYIYITTSSASPAGIFGGTWERIKDKFLLAAGDTYTAGSTGGSADAVVVEHRHLQTVSPASGSDTGVATWQATTLYNGGNKTTAYTSYEGVNGAGKNLPPYLVVFVWKRTA